MNTIKNIFFIITTTILITSCNENKIEYPNIPKEGRYFTDYILVTPSIDLNRDGVKSDDLFDEIHWVQTKFDFGLTVDNREEQGYRYLYFGYPYLYTDINDPNSSNAGAKGINTRFVLNDSTLVTENPAILSAILLNDSTIEVTSIAEFELLEGKKEVEMKAVYTWNSL